MEAAGQNGIPSAFVVDKAGVIAWMGHPMTLKEATVEKILEGTFDVKQEAAEAAERKRSEEKAQELAQAFGEAMKKKDFKKIRCTQAGIFFRDFVNCKQAAS